MNTESKKAVRIYNTLVEWQEKYGWSPNVREIMDDTGYTRAIIKVALENLAEQKIINLGNQARQISINPQSEWLTSK